MTVVLGADGARLGDREGWLACIGQPDGARFAFVDELEPLLDDVEPEAVAVDVPIGHADRQGGARGGRRWADEAAREALEERGSSVFSVPPPDVLASSDYEAAVQRARERGVIAPSRQVWGLAERIREAHDLLAAGRDLVETHPELAFQTLAGSQDQPGVEGASKRSWHGLRRRVSLLEAVGLAPGEEIGDAGRARPHDVLDAAACCWVARRIAEDDDERLPAEPPTDPELGCEVAVHV